MKKTAIVIEDDLDLGQLLQEILEVYGLDVELVHDGQLALDRLQETVPDLITLDIHLPNVSGFEILKQLRGNPKFDETKIVVITADVINTNNMDGLADIILFKPVRMAQIKAFIERLINVMT